MTEPTTHQNSPLDLALRMEVEPAPVDGCAGCAELANVRDRCRLVGDLSTVSDCNVLMRRHPEGHS
ncbi:hypothetical protein [Streptomyces sp. NBC_00102]|uniref:hypothetical protein n=1 Tax=Streptomyces sp. NBC_00102 TaxID=2975652 RepID=UPI00225587C2|nr:hypothetical protein [Streptomyces sp. NBC_00102]MCX5397804.1 hypothetical protein [Streptomyces sp. NBC_00102]